MFSAKSTLLTTIVAFLLLTAVQKTVACECQSPARRYSVISDDVKKSEEIITATVITGSDSTVMFDEQSVKVRIEKAYKGSLKVGEVLTFGQSGGKDCVWSFNSADIGKIFLFYLSEPTKARRHKGTEETEKSDAEARYYVSTCGRSAEIEKATDDISFLERRLKSTSILLPELTTLQFQSFVLCK